MSKNFVTAKFVHIRKYKKRINYITNSIVHGKIVPEFNETTVYIVKKVSNGLHWDSHCADQY
jgi:hypothetical protein